MGRQMAESYLRALDRALTLPLVPREQPINVGQLRMLAEIAGEKAGLNRWTLFKRETHEKPTVEARIQYLCGKGLIEAGPKAHYHDLSLYTVTARGRDLHRGLQGHRSLSQYKSWLDRWIALPINKRESPINVGQLKVHALVEREPNITTTELLLHFPGAKQTLKSRLKWLERKGLIERYPKFNAGGNGNPDFYVTVTDATVRQGIGV